MRRRDLKRIKQLLEVSDNMVILTNNKLCQNTGIELAYEMILEELIDALEHGFTTKEKLMKLVRKIIERRNLK